jgi:hypothetical protein
MFCDLCQCPVVVGVDAKGEGIVQGLFLPAEAAVQFQQCAVQQVKPEVRCPSTDEKKKKKNAVGEGAATLLQLPGIEGGFLRELEKDHKVKSAEVC